MKIKQILLFGENKGDLILQLKHWRYIVWLFLKNKGLIVLVVVAYYVRSVLGKVTFKSNALYCVTP